MKYNYDYKITYNDISLNIINNSQDTKYRKDIIQVFNLTHFFEDNNIDDEEFFKHLSNNVNELFLLYKENKQIKDILILICEFLRLPFEMKEDILFMYLFRFDLFYIFHKCLRDLSKTNMISDPNFQLLMNSIKKE